ncbi:MAG: hypothetical protein E7660_02875 [Ruminococcaceae bacterium]|nr:hypothetical protein [Oscillospiraceae bacterium]
MKDYRSTVETFKYSDDLEMLYSELQKRIKPNRVREMTDTGPEPDGKTPFIDVFREFENEPYPTKLAKAIVRSWMVSEPVVLDGSYLIGFARPNRPFYEHFSYGVQQARWVLDTPAYADRKDELNALMDEYEKPMNPLNPLHFLEEAWRRFNTPEHPRAYVDHMEFKLWWVGGYQGHTVPNYNTLMSKGIGGVHAEVMARLAEETDPHKIEMLTACRIILEGMRDWILMLADAAEKRGEELKAATGEDAARWSERFFKMAENCRRVSFDAPTDYYGAVQLVWFYSLWDWVDCVGRLDQYLYPFFKKSLEEDRQFTEDITASLMMNFLEHGIHNITVGGIRPEDGEDASNDLTFLLLQILRRTHETHPRMSVRINEKSDPALLALTVQMWAEGMSDPSIASDTQIIPAFINNYGVDPEDAYDYSLLGCQELELPGRSNFGCEDGLMNLAKLLEFTLNDGCARGDKEKVQLGLKTGHITDYDNFEDLFEAFLSQMRYFTKHFVELCNLGQEVRAANYAKLVKTCFTDNCIERGLNLDEGGAKYNLGCVETAGAAVVGDSFTAIKKLVFEEKLISKETLEAALEANFEGYEKERQLLLTKAPKYGNDDAEADAMVARVLEAFWTEIKKYHSVRGGEFSGACSLLGGGISYGAATWATPDGRRAGEPLGNSIGPRPGADKNGLTAMLRSCSRLPLEYGMGGTTCNILIPTTLMKTPEMRKNIEKLIDTYLKNGGQLGQITTACVDELIDAKKNPEAHSDLIVRLGGFSIRFLELSEVEQDEIISRFA